MGTLRFSLHPAELVQERPELLLAYVSGLDRMPTRTHVELEDGCLVLSRDVPESGAINVPWRVPGFGEVMLRSASLRERDEPYQLPLELARGKVNQLRNEIGDWELMGLQVPPASRGEVRDVLSRLTRALTQQAEPLPAAAAADETLAHATAVAESLAASYAEQLLAYRHEQYPRLNTLLSCRVGPQDLEAMNSPDFLRTFNSVAIQFTWKDIEPAEGEYNWKPFDRLVDWCHERKLIIKGGPLVPWSPNSLPAWLWLWEEDFDHVLSLVSDFVETVIARYRGRIRMWEVTSRTNCGHALEASEEDRVRLTVRALRAAKEMDAEATYVITLGQPWAEYMARHAYEYSPLHFADALIRADLGLGAIGLELVMGYQEDASYCRDQLEISELLDRYAILGVPIHVLLAAPAAWSPDDKATTGWSFGGGTWHSAWNDETHADWLDRTLRLVASKPAVQEISCCHFSDEVMHEFAQAGLVRQDGSARPALARVLQFREEHLR